MYITNTLTITIKHMAVAASVMVVVVVYRNRVVFFFIHISSLRCHPIVGRVLPNLNNDNIITILVTCIGDDEMKPISIACGPVATVVVKISPTFINWAGDRPPRGAQWRPAWRILRHRILLYYYYIIQKSRTRNIIQADRII